MQGSLITAFESVSVSENAGEPARLWRPRHVHVRSLKVLSNVARRGSFRGLNHHLPLTRLKSRRTKLATAASLVRVRFG